MADGRNRYRNSVRLKVSTCLAEKGSQPILFLGSGVSRRYFGAPSWRTLLAKMARLCPSIKKDFAYYEQSFDNMRIIGSEFAERFKEWAWAKGKAKFPEEYFQSRFTKSIFLKHCVATYLEGITPENPLELAEPSLEEELKGLQAIRPHAVVTTNYDVFLERLFPEYEAVVGQRILSSDSAFLGEIFKVHGCVTEPETLVLTEEDYGDFARTKKYLSAKLLTFFLEHPVLFVGYSAEDPNIRTILSDIDVILSADGDLIPNIFLLRRQPGEGLDADYAREELIPVDENRRVRIRTIIADDFRWVFKAFSSEDAIERIRPKLLRRLLARTCDLVRHDIPKRTVEVDYSVLEQAVGDDGELAKLYGITIVGDATHVNVGYPFSLTQVGELLGYEGWHAANKLLQSVREKTGHDLKASDNKYHVAVKAGKRTTFHKYSPHAVTLLRLVKENPDEPIDLDLNVVSA